MLKNVWDVLKRITGKSKFKSKKRQHRIEIDEKKKQMMRKQLRKNSLIFL